MKKEIIEKYKKQRKWVENYEVGEKELFAFLETYLKVCELKERKGGK